MHNTPSNGACVTMIGGVSCSICAKYLAFELSQIHIKINTFLFFFSWAHANNRKRRFILLQVLFTCGRSRISLRGRQPQRWWAPFYYLAWKWRKFCRNSVQINQCGSATGSRATSHSCVRDRFFLRTDPWRTIFKDKPVFWRNVIGCVVKILGNFANI